MSAYNECSACRSYYTAVWMEIGGGKRKGSHDEGASGGGVLQYKGSKASWGCVLGNLGTRQPSELQVQRGGCKKEEAVIGRGLVGGMRPGEGVTKRCK